VWPATDRAPLAFPGSIETAAFQSYVEKALVRELHARDVSPKRKAGLLS
jgi:hypothetical protein